MESISARDLMIPADAISSVGLSTSLNDVRNTIAGTTVALVTGGTDLLGVVGARAMRATRGIDAPLKELVLMLDPAIPASPDASAEKMYASLRDAANLWHVVYEGGELLGIVPPIRLVLAWDRAVTVMEAAGGLFGEIEGIPDEWLCCTSALPHCFTAVEATKLGVGPGSACPRNDGSVLQRRTRP